MTIDLSSRAGPRTRSEQTLRNRAVRSNPNYPDTLLPLSGLAHHDYGPGLPRALELEYSGADFAAKDALARRPGSAGA